MVDLNEFNEKLIRSIESIIELSKCRKDPIFLEIFTTQKKLGIIQQYFEFKNNFEQIHTTFNQMLQNYNEFESILIHELNLIEIKEQQTIVKI
jgi:hypothetical protein